MNAIQQLNTYTTEDDLDLAAGNWQEVLASAPDNGQLRITSDGDVMQVKKNGTVVSGLETPALIRLASGDSVSLGHQTEAVAGTAKTFFLPDNY